MNDYLNHLVSRDREESLLQPRIRAWFEQDHFPSRDAEDLGFEEKFEVATPPAPVTPIPPRQAETLPVSEMHQRDQVTRRAPVAPPPTDRVLLGMKDMPAAQPGGESRTIERHIQTETVHQIKEVIRPMQWPFSPRETVRPNSGVDAGDPLNPTPAKIPIEPPPFGQQPAAKPADHHGRREALGKPKPSRLEPLTLRNSSPRPKRTLVEKIVEREPRSRVALDQNGVAAQSESRTSERDQGKGMTLPRAKNPPSLSQSVSPEIVRPPRLESPLISVAPAPAPRAKAAEPRTVRVTIGRIEIRAEIPAQPKALPVRKTPPLRSLSEYLDGTAGRGER